MFTSIIFSKDMYYLAYLAYIMIISGLIKKHNLLSGVYSWLIKKIKSKKLLVGLISAVSGILPIPGRVVVSAGVLDTIAADEPEKRKKFGIIDFLCNHHYYFWSPLESTVITLMAVLSLSYSQLLLRIWPLLLISAIFIGMYIYLFIKEEDIQLKSVEDDKTSRFSVIHAIPLVVSIIAMIKGYEPQIVFPISTAYYILISRDWRVWKYLKWNTLALLFGVLCLGGLVKTHNSDIVEYIKCFAADSYINGISGLVLLSIASFFASLVMGSSSKFAGIVGILTGIFGLKYLPFFFAIEFAGYILSPTHKCVLTSSSYFKTPIRDYYRVLGMWTVILVVWSILQLLLA